MNNKLICLTILSLISSAFAQDKGIKFEHHRTWAEIKSLAKKESKYIFIDVFATWCGPCREMDRSVYTSEKVGDFMNKKFISVKVQADKTPLDESHVKEWYSTAESLLKEYEIGVFPTLLFLSPDAKVMKVCGFTDENGLIKTAAEAIDISNSYAIKLASYKNGEIVGVDLKELAISAKQFGDLINAGKIANDYINNVLFKLDDDQLFTKVNLEFIASYIEDSNSKAFKLFANQQEKINTILGRYKAQNAIMNFINKKYLPRENAWLQKKPNWDALEDTLVKKFGVLAKEKIFERRMIYCLTIQDWNNYGIWYRKYLSNFLQNTTYDPNYLSWILFEHVTDKNILIYACDIIMPYTIEKWYPNDFEVYDTYANLLYKIGRKDKAIFWEEAAVKLSNGGKVFVGNLDKMKKGIKTWVVPGSTEEKKQ